MFGLEIENFYFQFLSLLLYHPNMKNPYGEGSGSPVYASTDACLWPGDSTIWGSSNANQGKFLRVTTNISGNSHECKIGHEQCFIQIE